MSENQIRLIICLACAGLWMVELIVFEVRGRLLKKQIEAEGKTVPAAESRLLMILIISLIVIGLPFLIRFESLFVTAVIQACGVMATYIGLQERITALKKALEN
ncbi:MAG: hypothetical protein J6W60_04470 [Treponema sp.]|nr:hypothetical protein [Treponema sp.]MBP5752096.1 hypothetical protein [Treponema sp.]